MSRIEQIISDIEAYIDDCKYIRFSTTKIAVDKEKMEDLLSELRLRTPEEVKKYQRILNNMQLLKMPRKKQMRLLIRHRFIHQNLLTSMRLCSRHIRKPIR